MDIRQNKEWLEERKKGLGGSDSPVVLGVSPFKTKRELWMEKRGLIEEPELTPAMKRGIVLEDVIAKLYSDITKRKLRRKNKVVYHPKYPFMLANFDRLIVGEKDKGLGVLEIKCPGLKVFSQCKREGLPNYYTVQGQHYTAFPNIKWVAFAIFNAERWELIHFDVDKDDEFVDTIIQADDEFWKMVVNGIEPEEVEQKIDLPETKPNEIIHVSGNDWETAIKKLKEVQAIRKEVEALEQEAKQELQELMGDNQIIEGYGARIYWKWQNGREFLDSKKIKTELPDIWEKYKRVSKPFRVFKPYFLKETINE